LLPLNNIIIDISNIYSPKDVEGIACDDLSYTCVKLNNELFLYLKQVNKYLAFVCVIRDEVFAENRGIMDYNLTLFKDSVREILLQQQNNNNQQQQQQQQHQLMSANNTNDTLSNNIESASFLMGGALLATAKR
jgi:Ras-related GTP-binding protein C/D